MLMKMKNQIKFKVALTVIYLIEITVLLFAVKLTFNGKLEQAVELYIFELIVRFVSYPLRNVI